MFFNVRHRCAANALAIICLCASAAIVTAQAETRTLNNGNLVLQDIPEISAEISGSLARFQNIRAGSFQAWDDTGEGLYVQTRFGDVRQLHHVAFAAGARRQVTFFDEPIAGVAVQPKGEKVAFTMDAGGSEFAQIFVLNPRTGDSKMLSNGEARHGGLIWSSDGSKLAYYSTERNGRSNDVWVMDVDSPESRTIALESPDGTLWIPIDFSNDGNRLLVLNYVSVTDARVHLVDLETGDRELLAGGGETPSANYPKGIDADGSGYFFLTDAGSEFTQLAWAPLKQDAPVKHITRGISWDVEEVVLSEDGSRAAFVVNRGGISDLYLLDTQTHEYRRVTNLPTGVLGRFAFNADNSALALTLNTPTTPSDTFVLKLSESPLESGSLDRWTFSEMGSLNSDRFVEPELIEYSTFDDRKIPAFYYKPKGEGPHPVVISIHGGPEGQALPVFSSTYQMWIDYLGVAVLVPNVRGSAGYGKTYVKLDNGYLREDSVKDIGALLDWIADQSELDKTRVAVFGGSYGGYMVLASSVHYSDQLKAAVDIVGISNFVTFLENTQDYRRDLRRVEYGDERDPDMRTFLESISPLNRTRDIKIPMLVVQGQNDPRVPVTESEQLVTAMKSQGQTVWYMNALNEGHGYRKKENRDVYQAATVMFLQKYLLGNQ